MPRVQPIPPEPGQESVWDYPRPPRLEATSKQITIVVAGITIAETSRAMRVLETSHPPVYYLPPEDVRQEYLVPSAGASYCEFKGHASYYGIRVGERIIDQAAWYYPQPTPDFEHIRNFIAFYPGKMDACFVDGERVRPQAGGFYGGWITHDIVGPFKGEPGTFGW